jgi:hypothetical protein
VTQADLEPEILHRNAIADLLEANLTAQGSTGLTVYRDIVPANPEFPYLVVWGAVGVPLDTAERLAGYAGEITTSNQVTAAGLTVDDVLGAAGRCRGALHRQRPVIAGRRCGDLTALATGGRPNPDPQPATGGQTVYSLPVLVELHSSRKTT